MSFLQSLEGLGEAFLSQECTFYEVKRKFGFSKAFKVSDFQIFNQSFLKAEMRCENLNLFCC